jgi:hypothetical protein
MMKADDQITLGVCVTNSQLPSRQPARWRRALGDGFATALNSGLPRWNISLWLGTGIWLRGQVVGDFSEGELLERNGRNAITVWP